MPTPIVSSGIGVMSAMSNVRFGVSVWNALVVVVVLPPRLAVAVTVYFVAGLSVRLDFHWRGARAEGPAARAPPPPAGTVASGAPVALSTNGGAGRAAPRAVGGG